MVKGLQMIQESKKTGFSFTNKFNLCGVVIIIIVVLGLIIDTTKADNNNFYSDIIRLDNVATRIHQNYVEDINSEKLVDNAIDGMLDILDPHTSFFKKKEYEELRIHTEGKFGGLGIQISIREKVLTVMTPISGTPASRAGVQSGDQIVKIDGKSTKGITIDAAVAKLRGEPGSEVRITINRRGESKPLEFVITREIITINSVPFSDILENEIGYIRLLTFSQDAGEEIEKNIRRLLKRNIKGLILDLRHNPGGLLPQAIEVSEKFLERKSLVVSTRGRVSAQNKDYHASSNPILPKDLPLVVLVNAASASASEIVAGAIQDWDRGIVLGDTTFGKGSVQSILPLDKDHHLKLTTAFYYTPSGRCINKAENSVPNGNNHINVDSAKKEPEKTPDQMNDEKRNKSEDSNKNDQVASKDSVPTDTVAFKTNNGRIVYGGGGIIPDTIIEPDMPLEVVRALLLQDVFFKFANLTYPKLQKEHILLDSTFSISDKLMKSFYSFLDSTKFEYKSLVKSKFDEFKKWAGLIEDTVTDSSNTDSIEKPEWKNEELSKLEEFSKQIENTIKEAERREYLKSEEMIKQYLREALLVRGLGQDNRVVYRTKLATDNQVLAAVSVLNNKKTYTNLLEPVTK